MKKERGAKKTKFIRNLKVCFGTFSFFSGTGAEDENDKKLFFSSKTKFIIFFLSFKDENSFLVFFRKLGFRKISELDKFCQIQLLLAGRQLGSGVVALALLIQPP